MKIKILSFGICKDIIGQQLLEIELSFGSSIKDLKLLLQKKFPRLTDLKQLHIALNEVYAENDNLLKEGDEVALVPPVSGG